MTESTHIDREQFRLRLIKLCLQSGMTGLPRRRRDRHILLKGILLTLGGAQAYTHAEINAALDAWIDNLAPDLGTDRATLRRLLVDEGYLTRAADGSVYHPQSPQVAGLTFDHGIDSLNVAAFLRSASHWERREQVERFAGRTADRRLLELLPAFPQPKETRVLDLGCAGGRNAVVLAERGFDVHALDGAMAMVRKTRQRVAEVLDRREAEERVVLGQMDDLQRFAAGSFHLIVAVGIYHEAQTRAEWDRALDETARVLRPGGRVLVATFAPGSDPRGWGLGRVAGEDYLHRAPHGETLSLLEPEELDREMARRGLVAVSPSKKVVVKTDRGQRITVNAFYRQG